MEPYDGALRTATVVELVGDGTDLFMVLVEGHRLGASGMWPILEDEYKSSGYRPKIGDKITVEWNANRRYYYFYKPPASVAPTVADLITLLKTHSLKITLEPR